MLSINLRKPGWEDETKMGNSVVNNLKKAINLFAFVTKFCLLR